MALAELHSTATDTEGFVSMSGLANRESALLWFSVMMSAKCNPVPLQRFQAQVGMCKTTKKIHRAMNAAPLPHRPDSPVPFSPGALSQPAFKPLVIPSCFTRLLLLPAWLPNTFLIWIHRFGPCLPWTFLLCLQPGKPFCPWFRVLCLFGPTSSCGCVLFAASHKALWLLLFCCLQVSGELYSHSVDSSICPQELSPVQVLDRPGDMLLDKCHIGWFLHPADKPHSSPDGQSHSHHHPLLESQKEANMGWNGHKNPQKHEWNTKSFKLFMLFEILRDKPVSKQSTYFSFFSAQIWSFSWLYPARHQKAQRHCGYWCHQSPTRPGSRPHSGMAHKWLTDSNENKSTGCSLPVTLAWITWKPAYRGRFLLLPTLAWLWFCLFCLGFLLYLLGTFSPLSYSWSWDTYSRSHNFCVAAVFIALNNELKVWGTYYYDY